MKVLVIILLFVLSSCSSSGGGGGGCDPFYIPPKVKYFRGIPTYEFRSRAEHRQFQEYVKCQKIERQQALLRAKAMQR